MIEIPRGSFLKRGSSGHIDFVSPLPCPFNYGSVPGYIGGEGDLLDAVVLGPRLPLGTHTRVRAWGAIGLSERFMYDDKLICSREPLRSGQRRMALRFFHFYALCKGWLNFWRGRKGATRCEGWGSADAAIARARPIGPDWRGPQVPY
ncbi:inorganic diphosphatase [Sedimenticola hydrogenitrophicus]|uniref:inorganic diphosphatase n=1 Tax=Sedimenticola hydrogenitrophicus TaxID=2967975 RepID=UPI002FFB39A3